MKIVVPRKVVIETNEDGTYKTGVIQYQLRIDGVLSASKFYTMGIDNWTTDEAINPLLTFAKSKIEEGENLTTQGDPQ
jgi:hypothetical protein